MTANVTFITKQVLERSGHKCGLIGTIQNMIGDEALHTEFTTPDTYELHSLFARMADADCEFVVMEVSSHALEQGRVAGLHFAAACFTNLSEDHLDFHGTMEAYFGAKAKLFAMTDCAIINIDDAWGNKLRIGDDVELITYGIDNGLADIVARNVEFFADGLDGGNAQPLQHGHHLFIDHFHAFGEGIAVICPCQAAFKIVDDRKQILHDVFHTVVKGLCFLSGRSLAVIVKLRHVPKKTVIDTTKNSTPKMSPHFMYSAGSFVGLMIIDASFVSGRKDTRKLRTPCRVSRPKWLI